MREPNNCVPGSEVVAGRWSDCDKITTRTGTILNRTWAYHRSSGLSFVEPQLRMMTYIPSRGAMRSLTNYMLSNGYIPPRVRVMSHGLLLSWYFFSTISQLFVSQISVNDRDNNRCCPTV